MRETITKNQPLDATTCFQVAKSAHPTWVNKALRVARHVALSTLLLSGVNHAALAQALPTAQTIPLASAQFDKSLLTPVDHVLDKTLVRPYKNKPMNLGYVLKLKIYVM